MCLVIEIVIEKLSMKYTGMMIKLRLVQHWYCKFCETYSTLYNYINGLRVGKVNTLLKNTFTGNKYPGQKYN